MGRFSSRLIALWVLLSVGACVMYVDVPPAPVIQESERVYGGQLDSALVQVRSFRENYVRRYTGIAGTRAGIGTMLYGLVGASVGLAAAGPVSPAYVAGAGAGGATAYGVGTYLFDPGGQRVLQAGAQAVNCVENQLAALLIPKNDYRRFVANKEELGEVIAELDHGATSAGTDLLREAHRIYDGAAALILRVESAQVTVESQLYKIKVAVDNQLLLNERDLQGIVRSGGSLSGLAGLITPGAGSRFATGSGGVLQSFRGGAGGLSPEERAVRLMQALAPLIERVAVADRKLGELSACLPADEVPPRLNLPGGVLLIGTSEVRRIGIQSEGTPTAAITDGAPGVTATAQLLSGFSIVEVSTDHAVSGDRTLSVGDSKSKAVTTAIVRVVGVSPSGQSSRASEAVGPNRSNASNAARAQAPNVQRLPGPALTQSPAISAQEQNDRNIGQITVSRLRSFMHLPPSGTPKPTDQDLLDRVRLLQACLPVPNQASVNSSLVDDQFVTRLEKAYNFAGGVQIQDCINIGQNSANVARIAALMGIDMTSGASGVSTPAIDGAFETAVVALHSCQLGRPPVERRQFHYVDDRFLTWLESSETRALVAACPKKVTP